MNSKVHILFLLMFTVGIFKFNISYSIELDTPVLLFPSDKNEQVKDLIYIKWSSVDGANNYRYQLSKSHSFTEMEQESISKDTFKLLTNLNENSEYFWRVRAEADEFHSEWSEERVFYTVDTSRPNKIELVYPSSDLLLKKCNYLVEWERIRNNSFYDIELYDEDMNFILSDTTSEEFYQLDELGRGEVLNFHIRARNGVGVGEWNKFRFRKAKIFEGGISFSSLIYEIKKVDLEKDGMVEYLILKDDLESGKKKLCLNLGGISDNCLFEVEVNSSDNRVYLFDEVDLTIGLVNGYKIELYEYNTGFKKLGMIEFGFEIEGFYKFDLDRDLEYEYYVRSGGISAKLYEFDLDAMKYEIEDFSVNVNDINYLDLNGNNLLEMYVLSGNSLEVIEGEVNKRIDLGFVYDKMKVVNYDNDNYKDLLVYSEFGISILINKGGDELNFNQKVISFDRVENLEVRDVDNDGFEELVYINSDENDNYSLKVLSLKNQEIIFEVGVDEKYFAFEDDNIVGLSDLILNQGSGARIFENDICSDSLNLVSVEDLTYSYIDGSILLEWKDNNEYKWSNNYLVVVEGLNDRGIEKFEFNSINQQRRINLKSGYYNVYVKILTSSGVYSKESEKLRVKTSDLLTPPPKSWDYDILTGDRTTVILKHENDYKINGRDIENGDAIGVFYRDGGSLKCAGYRIWKEGENQAIAVWGDNNNTDEEKDGFEFGESFIYKLWDALEEKEIVVSAVLESGFNVFYPDTTTIIKGFLGLDTNIINLRGGKWQMISSYVSPIENDIDLIIGEGNIVFADELNNMKFPKKFNESLKYWRNNSGYYVYPEDDYELEIIGQKIGLNSPLFLESSGVFIMPNFSYEEFDIKSSFGEMLENFYFLKNDAGAIILPELDIYEFNKFEKNKSYLCYVKKDFVLKYSDIKENKKETDNTGVYSSFNNICDYKETKDNSHFLMNADDLGLSLNVYGDEDVLYICGELELGWNIIRLWANDPLTENKDGFNEGERVRIEILKNGKEIDFEFESIVSLLDSESFEELSYKSNRVIELELDIDGTDVKDDEYVENIEIGLRVRDGQLIFDRMGIENLKIIDTLGRIVFQETGRLKEKNINIDMLRRGSYIVEFMLQNRKEIRKFIF